MSRAGPGAVALGFRAHSGWAALVAVAGDARAARVALRARVDMVDDAAARQPYHAAEGLELPEAQRLLKRLAAAAERRARKALEGALHNLRDQGLEVRAAAVLQASGRLPEELARILASHALIHTADGVHFREALAAAAEGHGLAVARIAERDVAAEAAAATGRHAEDLQREVAAWGRGLGPPWTSDQKLAALAAWTLLARR
jgi:hypothetical protein